MPTILGGVGERGAVQGPAACSAIRATAGPRGTAAARAVVAAHNTIRDPFLCIPLAPVARPAWASPRVRVRGMARPTPSDPHGRVGALCARASQGRAPDGARRLHQQKIIYNNETFAQLYPPNIVEQYGVQIDQTICRGIDYLEFFVFVTKEDAGKTVESIARFYDFFFDAPTSLVNDGTSNIAIIGFGKIDENGRPEQSLLFREIVVDEPQQHQVVNSKDLGTGHHITIYVGNCDADFEVAASNCVDGELLWVNPHFLDRVLDVDEAMKCKQFRFKDIVDIHTGETLYVLEHEIRSISHPLFPGRS